MTVDVTFLLVCLDSAWAGLTDPLNGILGGSTKFDQEACRDGAGPSKPAFTMNDDVEAVPQA
ncbi:protein of unknown function [Methylorubrum extorquens]|uniref:Uncharacterized protein n=1 Tax=Methylorubrum extorquens TaxID=408 RepID=A0A2N9AVM2_METEX|nr:protein of unknown function [Methylorubrum extorquens]